MEFLWIENLLRNTCQRHLSLVAAANAMASSAWDLIHFPQAQSDSFSPQICACVTCFLSWNFAVDAAVKPHSALTQVQGS